MKMKSNLAKFGVVAGVAMMGLMASTPAFASSTTSSSTETLTVTAGSLSVSNTTAATIKAAVDASGTGALPGAVWADTTGSGNGWQGSVAATDLTYTGTWVASSSSTALATTKSSPFTGVSDGVTYTVKVTGAGTFTYTSTDANDASGSGTFSTTASAASTVGANGLSITLPTSVTSGTYTIQAGTQNASAIALDNSSSNTAATIAPVTGTTSANPTFVSANSTAAVTGGGTGSTSYGSAVTFLSAALNTGMGQYTVSPGATVAADMNSFAANYVGNIQYTIASGPAA
jgi:hypothetical protein